MLSDSSLKLSLVRRLEAMTVPAAVHSVCEPIFEALGRRIAKIQFPHFKTILVVQPDLIGDVVLTSPFLRELRLLYPSAWISLVVEPSTKNLVELCPYVDEIFVYDCASWRLYWRWKFCIRAAMLALRHLLWRNYDVAFFPQWDTDHYYGTMVAYLSGATFRISYSEATTQEKLTNNSGYNLLLSHALEDSTLRHEVEQKLYILRALGLEPNSEELEVWLGEEDEKFANRLIASFVHGAERRPIVAICPAGSHPRKLWPIERFTSIARWLVQNFNACIVIVGGDDARAAASAIRAALPSDSVINCAATTTLRQTAALLKRCALYVGNDTGAMHIAAALSVNVVAVSCHPLSASPRRAYSPVRFRPWSKNYQIMQPVEALDNCAVENEYCISDNAHCIQAVSEDAVKEAIETFLFPGSGRGTANTEAVCQ
jgi:ADP-heptose:LPS heptosyltransferase